MYLRFQGTQHDVRLACLQELTTQHHLKGWLRTINFFKQLTALTSSFGAYHRRKLRVYSPGVAL